MKLKTIIAMGLLISFGFEGVVMAEAGITSTQPKAPSTEKSFLKQNALRPEEIGTPIPLTTIPVQDYSDDLTVSLAIVKDPVMVGKYFDNKMWRKRFVPVYVSMENKGNFPIEVSTGGILLLEEKDPLVNKNTNSKINQLSATKPASISTTRTSSSAQKRKKELPPFINPTPPGVVFNKSKHVQYGWKSNLAMIAATGLTFGFAAPITVPAMVMGNMHRGTNKKLSNNLQDQSLSRITIEPGDKVNTWLFYRRDPKKRALLPKKIVFSDIYIPSKEQLSSFVVDLQTIATTKTAVRRKLEDSEVKDLQIFQGKIVAEGKEELAAEKMKDLEKLGASTVKEAAKKD